MLEMRASTLLILFGATIIFISFIVFGTDAFLSLLDFYQDTENSNPQEMEEGVSGSITSALLGIALGFLGLCLLLAGVITVFFEKRQVGSGDASKRKRFSEY